MRCKKIYAGTSSVKYIITTNDGQHFLLKEYESSQDPFHRLDINKKIANAGINIPLILDAGLTEDKVTAFELIEWIPGKSLDKLLEKLPHASQYKKGIKAGQFLKCIHNLNYRNYCNPNHMPLKKRVKSVVDGYDAYHNNGLPTYNGEAFKDYIIERIYMDKEDLCLLHGDFHTGNIIEDESENLWAIDWVYEQIGDPIEDFVRIFVSADRYPEFARGQVDGYFGDAPPLDFWHKLKWLTSIHQLEILHYSLGRLPTGQTVQEHQHTIVYNQYNKMRDTIPSFYMEGKNEY